MAVFLGQPATARDVMVQVTIAGFQRSRRSDKGSRPQRSFQSNLSGDFLFLQLQGHPTNNVKTLAKKALMPSGDDVFQNVVWLKIKMLKARKGAE